MGDWAGDQRSFFYSRQIAAQRRRVIYSEETPEEDIMAGEPEIKWLFALLEVS